MMLRSVKRREYQESFDRYCQFVEKKFPVSGSRRKSLWPPFRLPVSGQNAFRVACAGRSRTEIGGLTDEDLEMIAGEREKQMRLDCELRQKGNILNTKSLHAVLLTILYEVCLRLERRREIKYEFIF